MKQLFTVLSLCALLSNPSFAQEEVQISFTNEELKTLSPFEVDTQLRVLKDVLKFFKKEYDAGKAIPLVRVSESVQESETEIIQAVESQGMPAWGLGKGVNMFLFDLNIIVLGSDMMIHNLAHELGHYVQWAYRQYPKSEFSSDWVEMEVVDIQRHFRPQQ